MNLSKTPKVLIIDDDASIVKYLGALLARQGYETETAKDGTDGLEKAQKILPDLVLLDIAMPGLNGFEVTERLKGNPATSGIPILLMTGLESVDIKIKGLDSGVDDFLAKPFNKAELQARIRSLLKLKEMQDMIKSRPEAEPAPPAQSAAPQPADSSTILIADSDESMLIHYSHVIRAEGYKTVTARSGMELLSAADASVPDLIILDLIFPDIGGIDLLRRLNSSPLLESVPVMVTSTITTPDAKVKAIDAGADDYLVKPVNVFELLARIRAGIRKTAVRQKLSADVEDIFMQAITDPLTGLYNRRYLKSAIKRDLAYAKRFGRTFCMMIIDIDDFMDINDKVGRPAGDRVLQELGMLFRQQTRESDFAARYDGEEFIIILAGVTAEDAYSFAERIRAMTESHSFQDLGEKKLTVSIGVTELNPEDNDLNDLIKRAKQSLYRAKQEGKNIVR